MSELVLSLFPGIGLLDMAFEEQGFCVVRGPDVLWGGDVHRFHPPAGVFAGIIGGPPCQAFSRWRFMVAQHGYQLAENLIPEYERCVQEAAPAWLLMENVPDAPAPSVPGYGVTNFLLDSRWVGAEQQRVRRFSFGCRHALAPDLRRFVEWAPLEAASWAPTVNGSGTMGPDSRDKHRGAPTQSLAEACRLQGLPPTFLDDAPFSAAGKREMLGNAVPLPMGRAIAQAVCRALAAQQAAA